MPLYEYECLKCKAHIEILQKITDKRLSKCRKCGGRLEKQWSQSGFQFKGSGWYVTDYAGQKANAKEEKTGAATESKSGETSKTAEKATPAETPAVKKADAKKSPSSNRASGD